MTKDEIYERLIKVAAEVFEISKEDIPKDSKAGVIGQWDSLGHLNFFLAIEEAFNIKFSTEEIVSLLSLEEIVENIVKKNSLRT